MTLAIGRLLVPGDPDGYRTAFAVSGRYALTAYHCIGRVGTVTHPVGTIRFREGEVPVEVAYTDAGADVAVLVLKGPLPPGAEPVGMTGQCWPHDQWTAIGFPASMRSNVDGYAMSGTVTHVDGLLRGASVLQLHCLEAAAKAHLPGVSGAPILIGRSPRAVGVIRSVVRDDDSGNAVGGTIHACPVNAVTAFPPLAGEVLPAAGPSADVDPEARRVLMARLPLAPNGALTSGVSRTVLIAALLAVLLLAGGAAVVIPRLQLFGSTPGTPGPAQSTAGPAENMAGPAPTGGAQATASPTAGRDAPAVSADPDEVAVSAAGAPPWTIRGHGVTFTVVSTARTVSEWRFQTRPSITITAYVTRTQASGFSKLDFRISDQGTDAALEGVPFQGSGDGDPPPNQRSRLEFVVWDTSPKASRLTVTVHDFYWPDGRNVILRDIRVPS